MVSQNGTHAHGFKHLLCVRFVLAAVLLMRGRLSELRSLLALYKKKQTSPRLTRIYKLKNGAN
jgi:hypothetical protein